MRYVVLMLFLVVHCLRVEAFVSKADMSNLEKKIKGIELQIQKRQLSIEQKIKIIKEFQLNLKNLSQQYRGKIEEKSEIQFYYDLNLYKNSLALIPFKEFNKSECQAYRSKILDAFGLNSDSEDIAPKPVHYSLRILDQMCK